MFRTLGRSVIRAGGGGGGGGGLQESFAASSNSSPTSPRSASGSGHKLSSSHQLSLSSATSPFTPFNTVPVSAASDVATWLPFAPSSEVDDYEWVHGDGNEDERRSLHFDDFVLGSVPSTDEVHGAVSAIQQYVFLHFLFLNFGEVLVKGLLRGFWHCLCFLIFSGKLERLRRRR